MSIRGIDFLITAQHLAETGAAEACLRSAASRAYYSALHGALETLPDEFTPPAASRQARGSHEAILDGLRAWGNSLCAGREQARLAGRDLARLKRTRVEADYLLDTDFPPQRAQEALAFARQIHLTLTAARDRLIQHDR